MSLELTTLRLLKYRDRCERLYRVVPKQVLDIKTQTVLDDFVAYFKEFPEAKRITHEEFFMWFRAFRHPTLTDEQAKLYEHMLRAVQEDVSPDLEAGLMARLVAAEAAYNITEMAQRFNDGEDIDLFVLLREEVERFEAGTNRKVKVPWVTTDIGDMLLDEENDTGLHWRWDCINLSMRPLRGGDFIVLAGRPDKGKCLHPDTPVRLATGGTIRAADVRTGMLLAGPSGARTVRGTAKGRAPMYRVSYPWGESYTVNDAHVLSLKRSKREGIHRTGDILNVPVSEYVAWPEGRKGRYKGWKAGVDFPEQTQTMPPYLLGVWLGDGTTAKPQITTVDSEILEEFVKHYGPYSACYEGITYDWARCALRGDLKGLLNNKHIPAEYMYGSRRQRLELLAGLIDSDGHAGDVYEITTKLPALAEQYVELARSLGFHATVTKSFKRATNCAHKGDWYSRVRIGSEAFGEVPVRLPHKRGNNKPRKRQGLHFGIRVEAVGVGDYAGFELDGDHLFLLGDFTVTHNTTAITDNITHMSKQVFDMYAGERDVVWMNNEGPGKRIKQRCYQSALNLTIPEMVERYHKPSTKGFNHLLDEQYAEAVGGLDRIKIMDIHDFWSHEVEDILRRVPCGLLVLDMVDNIKFGGKATNGGERTDQLLEAMYQWARVLAFKWDIPIIATSQISAEGDGFQYPTLGQLKDSRTGKQGAAEAIITIGASNDPMLQNSRFIGSTKNKLHRYGGPKDPRTEMIFDGERGRYLNPQKL